MVCRQWFTVSRPDLLLVMDAYNQPEDSPGSVEVSVPHCIFMFIELEKAGKLWQISKHQNIHLSISLCLVH